MHFNSLRKVDKILIPITFRIFPYDVILNGLRTLVNKLYNKYLMVYRGRFPPEVLYHSNNYLLINKGCDIKINSNQHTEYTVATQLKEHFPELADDTLFHDFRFTHRLDYPTSGVLCIALNQKAAGKIQKQFLKKKITKHYLALYIANKPYRDSVRN